MKRELTPAIVSDFRGSFGVFSRSVISILLLCGLASCQGESGDHPSPDGGPGHGAADASESTSSAPAEAVTFRLTYQPSDQDDVSSIYVSLGCTQEWVRVLDSEDNVQRIDQSCGWCSCDSCDPCAVCGCLGVIEPIASDSSREHDWGGVLYPLISKKACLGGLCESEAALPAGTYTAEFCYYLDQEATLRRCGEEEFDYPVAGGVVEHIVKSP